MITKVHKIATDTVLGGFEEPLLRYQAGFISSAVNSATTYLPCSIDKPISVIITPFNFPNDANNVAFANGYEIASLEDFNAISSLPALAENTNYYKYQIVSYDGKAYQCINSHTSPSGDPFVAEYWEKLTDENFLKVNHAAPGAGKVAVFSYLVIGYDF